MISRKLDPFSKNQNDFGFSGPDSKLDPSSKNQNDFGFSSPDSLAELLSLGLYNYEWNEEEELDLESNNFSVPYSF